MGRPRSCECGTCPKCQRRDAARERYQQMTVDERREMVGRRDIEKIRARDRVRNSLPHRVSHITSNTKQWREKNPDRYAAHNAVAYAVRTGAITKEPCEVCGEIRAHGHHDDYTKPLEVRWLCAAHHAAEKK